MRELQDIFTTSLYSQLFDEALANECISACPGIQGKLVKESRKNSDYWYWLGRNNDVVVKRIYIGSDTQKTRDTVKYIMDRHDSAAQAIASMKKTAAAYKASGGQQNEPAHFKIIALLAQQQLFSKGVMIVGSHAFLSICNAMGVSATLKTMFTTDVDFARPQSVALAIPDERKSIADVPVILKEFDKNFFLVPDLDPRNPSTSLQNNKTKVKVDFLTSLRGQKKPVVFEDLGIAAEPLKYMDYLMNGSPLKGLIVGSYAIPANFPDPARFAVHKLIISQERAIHHRSKTHKDIYQAEILLDHFIKEGEADLIVEALSACAAIEGAFKNIKKSLVELKAINSGVAEFIDCQLMKLKSKATTVNYPRP